jgi:drug/metabolite transporter (DMT)-like permease
MASSRSSRRPGTAPRIFGTGLALQQREPRRDAYHRPRGVGSGIGRATITRPSWIVGILGGGVVGFVVSRFLALNVGSLSIVEPMQTTQMIFTVPLSAWVARTRVTSGEWGAASLLVLGLLLLTVALAPEPGAESGRPEAWVLVIPAFLAVTVAAVVASRRWTQYAAACLGLGTGVLFGVQGGLVKQALDVLGAPTGLDLVGCVGSPAAWAAGAFTVVAIVLQNLALRAGRLSAAQTTITTTAPVASVIVGVVVFGETLQLAPLRVLAAIVGAGLCLWGIAHLARSPALLAAVELAEAGTRSPTVTVRSLADPAGSTAGARLRAPLLRVRVGVALVAPAVGEHPQAVTAARGIGVLCRSRVPW